MIGHIPQPPTKGHVTSRDFFTRVVEAAVLHRHVSGRILTRFIGHLMFRSPRFWEPALYSADLIGNNQAHDTNSRYFI